MIVAITGGTASGKSEFAEKVCLALGGRVAYVATMQPFGEDARRRIARHLALREGKGFATVEQYRDIGALAERGLAADTLLIECMSNLTANEMFEPGGQQEHAAELILAGIGRLAGAYPNLVIVTNDIGGDGITYGEGTAKYIKQLGQLNQGLFQLADMGYEVVCGIPVCLCRRSGADLEVKAE